MTPRIPVRRVPFAALAALLLLARPADPAATGPSLTMLPARIVAGPALSWKGSLEVENRSDQVLTLDSLTVVVRDLDAGETRAPRETSLPLERVIPAERSIAARGRMTIPFEVPAPAESASLRFEARMSSAGGQTMTLRALGEATPGPTSRRLPSQFLAVEGRRVEMVLVPSESTAAGAGAPGVLLVHGHGHHARNMLRGALLLARHGFTAMCVSMPGYGLSEGPADLMGPRTVAALSAALDQLAHTDGVDARRLAAWGVSRGATAVTLLAEQRSDLRAVIAQAGLYDLRALQPDGPARGIYENVLAEAGTDSAAWRERSPILSIDRLRGQVLVMHGEDDASAPAAQAHAFYEALRSRGTAAESHFFAAAGHALPRDETARLALVFLERALRR